MREASTEVDEFSGSVVDGYTVLGDGLTDGLPRAVREPNPTEGRITGHMRIPPGHLAFIANAVARYEDCQDKPDSSTFTL